MTTAYIFPGQGSQHPGMGAPFYDAWSTTQEHLQALSTAIDRDLADLCFETSAERLQRTANAQPALYAIGTAVLAGLRERTAQSPDFVAGHSLGHLTALSAAGMLAPDDGIHLARDRGDAFQSAAATTAETTMVAVLLADPETVATVCSEHSDVVVALRNAPRQTVLSGTQSAIEAVQAELETTTRARFRELSVAAGFHSPFMAPAVDPVVTALADTPLTQAARPVVSDVSGCMYRRPAVAREELRSQVTTTIDWVGAVRTLDAAGVDQYVVFPPADDLSTLVDRTATDATVHPLSTPADIEVITDG